MCLRLVYENSTLVFKHSISKLEVFKKPNIDFKNIFLLKTLGRIVRNLENNLNYIYLFLIQIIIILNLFRDNYKVKSLN
jgi:hypothetical protein